MSPPRVPRVAHILGAHPSRPAPRSDLLSVPQDLRECLESLLALDPTPENLDIYLPRVRAIIVTLLSGLKAKQAVWRKASGAAGDVRRSTSRAQDPAQRHRSRSPVDPRGRTPPPRPDLPAPNQMLSSSASTTSIPATDRHHSVINAATTTSINGSLPSRARAGPLPPAPPDAFRPPRRRVTPTTERSPPRTPVEQTTLPSQQESRALPVPPLPSPPSIPTRSAERERYALRDAPSPSPSTSPVKRTPTTPPPPRRRSGPGPQTDGLGSRFSLDSETETPKTRRRMTAMMGAAGEASPGGFLPPLGSMPSLEEGLSVDTTSKRVPPPPPPAAPPTTTDQSPAALASLTALQNSEALGRRASKRFSQYQYKQLLPGHARGPSGRHSRMGSVVEREMEAEGTPSAEVPPVPAIPEAALRREPEQSTVIPTIVVPDSQVGGVVDEKEEPVVAQPLPPQAEPAAAAASPTFPVFLQYGRETRKATLDRRDVTTIADLQALFVAKFEYAPADGDLFPDVYIKDPGSGVAYLLEDMEDVREGVLLSLNIDRESPGALVRRKPNPGGRARPGETAFRQHDFGPAS